MNLFPSCLRSSLVSVSVLMYIFLFSCFCIATQTDDEIDGFLCPFSLRERSLSEVSGASLGEVDEEDLNSLIDQDNFPSFNWDGVRIPYFYTSYSPVFNEIFNEIPDSAHPAEMVIANDYTGYDEDHSEVGIDRTNLLSGADLEDGSEAGLDNGWPSTYWEIKNFVKSKITYFKELRKEQQRQGQERTSNTIMLGSSSSSSDLEEIPFLTSSEIEQISKCTKHLLTAYEKVRADISRNNVYRRRMFASNIMYHVDNARYVYDECSRQPQSELVRLAQEFQTFVDEAHSVLGDEGAESDEESDESDDSFLTEEEVSEEGGDQA